MYCYTLRYTLGMDAKMYSKMPTEKYLGGLGGQLLLSGILTPLLSGKLTPLLSGKLTPRLSGILTPLLSDILTPILVVY